MRDVRLVVAFVAAMLMAAAEAWACSCVSTGGPPKIDDIVHAGPVVVVGRLDASGDPAVPRDSGPKWIDLVVEHVVKGDLALGLVRIWDDFAGSSCGGRLSVAQPSRRIVVALERVRDVTVEEREAWTLMGFKPPEDGLLISRQVCAMSIAPLTSPRDERRWMRRRIR